MIDRRQTVDKQLRKFNLADGRGSEGAAERYLVGDCSDDLRLTVSVDHRGEVIYAVVVDIAVHVPNPTTFPSCHIDRERVDEDGSSSVAAGHDLAGALEGPAGFRQVVGIMRH